MEASPSPKARALLKPPEIDSVGTALPTQQRVALSLAWCRTLRQAFGHNYSDQQQ